MIGAPPAIANALAAAHRPPPRPAVHRREGLAGAAVILDTPLDAAWAALSTLPPARGTVAGYTGTARLEEADDDTHTAILRLNGSGPRRPVDARRSRRRSEPVARAAPALHFSTPRHPQPDAASIHVLTATLAAALTQPGAAATGSISREVGDEARAVRVRRRRARVEEAVAALDDEDARVLAGGQSLVPLLNLRARAAGAARGHQPHRDSACCAAATARCTSARPSARRRSSARALIAATGRCWPRPSATSATPRRARAARSAARSRTPTRAPSCRRAAALDARFDASQRRMLRVDLRRPAHDRARPGELLAHRRPPLPPARGPPSPSTPAPAATSPTPPRPSCSRASHAAVAILGTGRASRASAEARAARRRDRRAGRALAGAPVERSAPPRAGRRAHAPRARRGGPRMRRAHQRQRRTRRRRAAHAARRTSSATTGSPAPRSAASTASAARARCSSTASPSARA